MAHGLPAVNAIGMGAPFRWLARAWGDLGKAPAPFFAYGLAIAALSFWLSAALIASNLAFWVLTLTCGFVFVAPMLAMGLYEAGRMIEAGEKPTLARMLVVRAAIRQDVFYLGLALVLIYLLWGRIAQVVYGLSTYRLHTTVADFVEFALGSGDGHAMLISGAIIGGVVAFFTFCLVAISAPMLLESDANVFAAAFTSLRAVAANFAPMLLWAGLIAVLMLLSAATAWTALIVVFPWLGLASWRAYRDLVSGSAPAAQPVNGLRTESR